jgi:hypothetical protein
MTEDAPNAIDHDEDGKRIASSHSYDLPNQEDNDNDVIDRLTRSIEDWEDKHDDTNQGEDEVDDGLFKWDDEIEDEDDPYAELFKEKEDEIEDESDDEDDPFAELFKETEDERDNDDGPFAELFKETEDERETKEAKREADEAAARKWRERVREHEKSLEERKMRIEERKMRRKTESQHTIMISTPPNKDATSINKTEIALLTKAIKSKVGISTQSNNIPKALQQAKYIPSVSYNKLSDRTASNNKSPPSSSEWVTNSDAKFDRDNPSLSSITSIQSSLQQPSAQSIKPSPELSSLASSR